MLFEEHLLFENAPSTYILDSHTYAVGYICPDLTRRGVIFSYKRRRLSATNYRSGAAVVEKIKTREKIKTERIIGIASEISAYCAYHQVLKTVFHRKRETRATEKRQRVAENIETHRWNWANLKTRGDYIPPILYQRQERLLL